MATKTGPPGTAERIAGRTCPDRLVDELAWERKVEQIRRVDE